MLGGAFLVSQSVDRVSAQIPEFELAMKNLQTAVVTAAGARPAAPAAPAKPARRRGPDPDKVYTVATTGSQFKGPQNAKVAIVEFSDFQCPFCSRVGPTLAKINQDYPQDVKVVFKHLPLAFHNKAMGAAQAAEAAGKQGKFWEMHDLLFQNQRALSEEKYVEWAGELKLDIEKFKKDMVSAEVKQRIEADKREASKLGVTGTPGFFINGRFLSGAKPYDSFKAIIDKELGKS
jgi:protein-disulfide isomerase